MRIDEFTEIVDLVQGILAVATLNGHQIDKIHHGYSCSNCYSYIYLRDSEQYIAFDSHQITSRVSYIVSNGFLYSCGTQSKSLCWEAMKAIGNQYRCDSITSQAGSYMFTITKTVYMPRER